jgi:hypothetical protein
VEPTSVVEFVRRYLEAEAALAIAALGEPDNDRYLVIERQAKAFYLPGAPLYPLESRWAPPGGTSPNANIDVRDSVRAGHVFAVATTETGDWIALVGGLRDAAGVLLSEGLLVCDTPDGLRIAGRTAVDPFSKPLTFEPAGGEPVDLGRAKQVTVLHEPSAAEHAEFVRRWGAPSNA